MTVVCPFRLVSDVQNLFDLHDHHLRVFIARVKEKHSQTIDDVTIGLPIENGDEATFHAVEIVKSWLCEMSSTPDWVAIYFPS